jgi:hypothetical protein
MFAKRFLWFFLFAISLFISGLHSAEAAPELRAIHRVIDGIQKDIPSQFIIEDNEILTLRFIRLQNVDHSTFKFNGPRSTLVLQSVTLELCDDITFDQGSVVIRGAVSFSRSKGTFRENPTIWVKEKCSFIYDGNLYLNNVVFRNIIES